MGIKTTAGGVDGLLPQVLADGVQIAFDAASAYADAENRPSSTRRACISIVSSEEFFHHHVYH